LFLPQQWLHERVTMMHYTYNIYLVTRISKTPRLKATMDGRISCTTFLSKPFS